MANTTGLEGITEAWKHSILQQNPELQAFGRKVECFWAERLGILAHVRQLVMANPLVQRLLRNASNHRGPVIRKFHQPWEAYAERLLGALAYMLMEAPYPDTSAAVAAIADDHDALKTLLRETP